MTNDYTSRLRFETDENSRKKIEAEIKRLRDELAGAAQSNTELSASAEKARQSLVGMVQAGELDITSYGLLASKLTEGDAAASKLADELAQAKAQLAGLEGDELNSQLSTVSKLERAYKDLQGEIEDIPTALRQSTAEADRLQSQIARFDDVSRNVGLAGDVQSNLGAIGGLAGAAGAGGAANVISIGGEGIALVEELPRLKESLAGLPSTIAASAAALGPFGLALGAIAAVAAVGLIAYKNALDEINEAAQRNADAAAETAQTQANVQQLLLSGDREAAIQALLQAETELQNAQLATANLRERQQQAQAARDAENLRLAENQQNALQGTARAADSAAQSLSNLDFQGVAEGVAGVGAGIGLQVIGGFQQGVDALDTTQAEANLEKINERFSEFQERGAEALGEVESINEVLGDFNISAEEIVAARNKATQAAQEATRAEEELAEVRTALTSADDIAQQLQAEQRALAASAEQNQARLDAIANEKDIIAAQIASLEESGVVTEEITARIDSLNNRFSQLGQEAAFIEETLPGVLRAEDLEAQREKLSDFADELGASVAEIEKRVFAEREAGLEALEQLTADSFQRQAEAAQRYNDNLQKIAEDAAKAAEDALSDLQSKRDELAKDFGRDEADASREAAFERLDIQLEAQRAEAESLREHARRIENIRKDARRREEDAISGRDALALFNSRRQETRAIEDANVDFSRGEEDRTIALDEQFTDLQTSLERERQERLIAFERANTDAQAQYQVELLNIQTKAQEQRQALNDSYAQEQADLDNAIAQRLITVTEGNSQIADSFRNMYAEVLGINSNVNSQLAQQSALAQQVATTLAAPTISPFGLPTQTTTSNQIVNNTTTTDQSVNLNGVQLTGQAANDGIQVLERILDEIPEF